MYDCEIPRISATSFCVSSLFSTRFTPNRSSIICLSRSFNDSMAFFSSDISTSVSRSLYMTSSSVPSISDKSSSFPSQSVFSGSSKDTSSFTLLLRRRYIRISFSMHLDAYVASFIFFSGLNVFIPFMRPIVPIDIRSSTHTPVFSNFFARYTTSLRLCSISCFFACSFDIATFLSTSAIRQHFSSSVSSGGGSTSVPPM